MMCTNLTEGRQCWEIACSESLLGEEYQNPIHI